MPQRSVSIIVEMENASTVPWEQVGHTLQLLAEQIAEVTDESDSRPEVICVVAGSGADAEQLKHAVASHAPRLGLVAELICLGVPGGRYYELKNAGINRASREIVVMLDSDATPEPGWLSTLLAPFDDPATIAVAGHTYLGYDCLISRTLALVWVFPLRNQDAREANRRPLFVNNCAMRSNWIKANPFPIDDGFKVSCTLLGAELKRQGHEPVRAPAYVSHAPLAGVRFLAWRAWVIGRDADRKHVALKGSAILPRLSRAVLRGFKTPLRAVRRVIVHHRKVALPLWQVPLAAVLGACFYAVAVVGQLAQLSGCIVQRPERVPSFAEEH